MAESTLHPRPNFATFLKSDANGPQDSISYYEEQRALRFQKVAVLQQKRENAYAPGYKRRPASVPATTTLAERAEALSKFARPKSAYVQHRVSIDPVPVEIEPSKPQLKNESKVNIPSLLPGISGEMSQPSVVLNQKKEQGPLKPIIVNRDRNIKSATSRKTPQGTEEGEIQKQRPVTVPRVTMKEDGLQGPLKDVDREGSAQVMTAAKDQIVAMSEAETSNLYKSYQYGTSTQRSYKDAGWEDKMDKKMAEHPTAGFRNLPDPITYRLTYRRYNSEPGVWQSFGTNWDYIQPRRGDTYPKGPQSITFGSNYPAMRQIPGYSGCSPALTPQEFDQYCDPLSSVMRTVQPHYTDISRKGNIPGYTGHVHWSNSSRAHSVMPFPEPTTTARIHRSIPIENDVSPFRRDGVLSRMVTTVPPNNPFRRIQY